MKQLLFSTSLADCDMQTYIGPGNGGQKKNRTKSGVRLVHRPSGATGQCHETRSQHENKRIAFFRMIETTEYKNWHSQEVDRRLKLKSIDEKVDEMMGRKQDFKIEVKDERDGTWKDVGRMDERATAGGH